MTGSQKNKKIKVFIVEDEVSIRRSLLNFLGQESGIDICAFFTSGFDIISKIKFYKPDVVITDFLATDVNGIKILEIMNSEFKNDKPKIIVTSYTDNVSVLEQSFKFGIDYYIKKPIILSLLKDAIFTVCRDKTKTIPCEMERKVKIKNLLKILGIPSNILGYTYIEEALEYMINLNKIVFLSEIYGKIGDAHETSLKCVEASIRNAIKKAASTNNDKFKEVFGLYNQIPSNSTFLSVLREKIVIEEINNFTQTV